jgi:2-iminobutanoate/2-iminopropanoate deaminase
MTKKIVATDQAPAAIGPYSQGVVLDGWLWTCGQVALDPATGELVGTDAAAQARQALENLSAILQAAGTRLDQVVRTTVYLVDMGDFAAVNKVYAGFFEADCPARACVEVSGLPLGALVEIDAIARVG